MERSSRYYLEHLRDFLLSAIVLFLVGVQLITWPLLWSWLFGQEAPNYQGGPEVLTRQVGLAFLVSGLLGLFYQFRFRNSFSDLVKGKVVEAMNERYEALGDQQRAGIGNVFKSFPHDQFRSALEDAKEKSKKTRNKSKVRILQTWTGKLNDIGNLLLEVADQGAEVQVLLLNPDFPKKEVSLAQYRGSDMRVGRGRNTLLDELDELKNLCDRQQDGGKMEIKVYSTIPAFSMFAVDDVAYVGFYWTQRRTIEGPQLQLISGQKGEDPFLKAAVYSHFDRLWENADTWCGEQEELVEEATSK